MKIIRKVKVRSAITDNQLESGLTLSSDRDEGTIVEPIFEYGADGKS